MLPYLTATLYAPFASFGGLAVGERRGSERHPTRSALIGLLGAALGTDRADEAAQHALAQGYGFATQTLASGRLLTDYHTAQMPGARGKRRFATRREELQAAELGTVLTSRDYRTDALFSLALWPREAAPFTLQAIANALKTPRYTLCLGRKSCPLGLPLAPRITDHPSAVAALHAHWHTEPRPPEAAIRRALHAAPGEITLDRSDAGDAAPVRVEFIRDQPLSRRRWQFGLREAAILRGGA
ncbi:type I-E CRISPR-associated protein Cas5/CasD [Acidiphilium acidophilum]|uniref:type I-E CRISPR-associated protein Cas5/CasD n=1 Tax=Acidiphilium acidophilum TaxID=76588 RepID=UPI002E8E6FA2|nr:type I-E CRISPR-associated protein Cas5/CasD [Acidiphilium acidophilum]